MRGFTLIELIIVIVLVGILASIALPKYLDLVDNANIAAAQGIDGAFKSAVQLAQGKWQTSGGGTRSIAFTNSQGINDLYLSSLGTITGAGDGTTDIVSGTSTPGRPTTLATSSPTLSQSVLGYSSTPNQVCAYIYQNLMSNANGDVAAAGSNNITTCTSGASGQAGGPLQGTPSVCATYVITDSQGNQSGNHCEYVLFFQNATSNKYAALLYFTSQGSGPYTGALPGSIGLYFYNIGVSGGEFVQP